MRLTRTPFIAAAAAVLGLTIGGAVVAVAAIPNEDGQITACYVKPGGTLRITSTGTCKKGETPLSWDQSSISADSYYSATRNDVNAGSNTVVATSLCDLGDIPVGTTGLEVQRSSYWHVNDYYGGDEGLGVALTVFRTSPDDTPYGGVVARCLDSAAPAHE